MSIRLLEIRFPNIPQAHAVGQTLSYASIALYLVL